MVKFNDKKSQELLKGQITQHCQNLVKYNSKQSSQNLVTRVYQNIKSLTKTKQKTTHKTTVGRDRRLARKDFSGGVTTDTNTY